jgi:hypothetical protein
VWAIVFVFNKNAIDAAGLQGMEVRYRLLNSVLDAGGINIARQWRQMNHADNRLVSSKAVLDPVQSSVPTYLCPAIVFGMLWFVGATSGSTLGT